MFRKALWPSDGDTDAVIHHGPADCGMVCFYSDRTDESVVAAWNARATDARIAALEEALRPFQNYANATLHRHSKHQPDSEVIHNIDGAKITLGDLRRARALLDAKP
tara:strand:+ start:14889 stop:15209 length:321 start_codon:yes stop_codon:yes gene_type:complete